VTRYTPSVVPTLPREQWEAHPRFRTQTLLLRSHEAFRRRSTWIIDHLRDLDPAGDDVRRRKRWLSRMSTDFDWWMAGMRGHERYEERKLYRYLAHRFGGTFAELEAGHRLLHVHRERVERTFQLTRPGEPDEPVNLVALIDELENHRQVLVEHLRSEEDYVIPMLLALTIEEFSRYYNTPIKALLEH
jgi:hypothetical protein